MKLINSSLLCIILVIGLTGCLIYKIKPTDYNYNQTSSVIGVVITVVKSSSFEFNTKLIPVVVHFIIINANKEQVEILNSNYNSNNSFYLLNAQPGKYAIIGVTCRKFIGGPGFKGRNISTASYKTLFFQKKIIDQTITDVKESSIAFLGEYCIDSFFNTESFDETQNYYSKIMPLKYFYELGPSINYAESDQYGQAILKSYRNDSNIKSKFLLNAKADFKDTKWINLINR